MKQHEGEPNFGKPQSKVQADTKEETKEEIHRDDETHYGEVKHPNMMSEVGEEKENGCFAKFFIFLDKKYLKPFLVYKH